MFVACSSPSRHMFHLHLPSSSHFVFHNTLFTIVTNSFVRVINLEKRNQNIRDDILEMNDLNPSYTRQHQGEWEAAVKRNEEANMTVYSNTKK